MEYVNTLPLDMLNAICYDGGKKCWRKNCRQTIIDQSVYQKLVGSVAWSKLCFPCLFLVQWISIIFLLNRFFFSMTEGFTLVVRSLLLSPHWSPIRIPGKMPPSSISDRSRIFSRRCNINQNTYQLVNIFNISSWLSY